MKWCIILVSMFAVIHSRPQNPHTQKSENNVELEKQTIIEVTPNLRKYVDQFPHPTQRNIQDDTNKILERIAEVNKNHGLVPKKQKPNYFHFPISYSRSQDEERSSKEKAYTSSPFSNPILEYLIATKNENDGINRKYESEHDADNYDEYDDEDDKGYEKSVPNSDISGITKEDIIPGQYIKRKIVHQQTFAVPMQNMYPQFPNFMGPQNVPNMPNLIPPVNIPPNMIPGGINQNPPTNENKETTTASGAKKLLSNLEKQTVDNVKSIVSNTQMLQPQGYPLFYNPYLMYPQLNADPYPYSSVITPNKGTEVTSNDQYSYRVYGPYPLPSSEKARQNWNWPGANYFPIYIRDPFLQFYNAITSMVEYGPNAGQGGPCKRPPKIKGKDDRVNRKAKINNQEKEQLVVEMEGKTSGQITIRGAEEDNEANLLNIENIDIGGNKESGLKFTVSVTNERNGKVSARSKELESSENSKEVRQTFFTKPKPLTTFNTVPSKLPPQNPPTRNSTIQVQEVDDEFDEDDKSEEVSISNDGNKKLFSRDNTGSGIFIHKLKVRKGGVAIAGPGGIATAGSGGTAIVGPNGVAFTQPDSLAIAGSGSKVVAVDPTINLGDLINDTLANRNSTEIFPPTRVGKVVAVGPVIYYNRGDR